MYSLNYFDGDEFILLKNDDDFECAIEETHGNTLIIEIRHKDEEELEDADLIDDLELSFFFY